MHSIRQDLRFGLRMLMKHPGFTLAAVLTLALGIGANTAIFSIVNAVVLRPLPYDAPERLVALSNGIPKAGVKSFPLSQPEFVEYRQRNSAFEHLAAYSPTNYSLTGDGEPERLPGLTVSANFFTTLGIRPILGRTFNEDENQPGNTNVAIITHGLWTRRFGNDPGVVGKTVLLNGAPHQVVGVVPDCFDLAPETELCAPAVFQPNLSGPEGLGRQSHRAVARLKPERSITEARAETDAVAGRFHQANAGFYSGSPWRVTLTPLHAQVVGDVRPAMLVLFAAVGLLLLIACANVANLSLVRAVSRRKETSVRLALGAGRLHILRQMLVESLLTAFLGGSLGLPTAFLGLKLLQAYDPGTIPRLAQARLDGDVLLFTLVVSLVSAVLFGIAPALEAFKSDIIDALKAGTQTAVKGAGEHRLRNALAVGEIALALILLIGAGLLVKSFSRLSQVDPGFSVADTLTMRLSPPRTKYPDTVRTAAFYRRIVERVQALPGVQSVGGTSALPLTGQDNRSAFSAEGWMPTESGDATNIHYRLVTPDYFRTLDIPMLQGRTFSDGDGETAPPVVVVNRTLAQRVWPNQNPLDRRLTLNDDAKTWYRVIGVVADVKHDGLASESGMEVFFHYPQAQPNLSRDLTLVVRTTGTTSAVASAVRQVIREIDPDQPVYQVRAFGEVVSSTVAQPRFQAGLVALFGLAAVVLAVIGVYGVLADSVERRTSEIGLRVALGAGRSDILGLVLRRGMRLISVGVVLGLGTALAVMPFLKSLLYEVSPVDPATFSLIALGISVVGVAACLVPAMRAMRTDPITALRNE